jgi:hypothetical protein
MLPKKPNNPRRFVRLTAIPFEMFMIIFGGYKLGAWLDEKYPNDNYIYTLISTVTAVILAMVYIIRKVQKLA